MNFALRIAVAIVVPGHTECGAAKGACDNVEMGNLTTVIQAIRPALGDVPEPATERNSKNKGFLPAVTVANVRRTVAKIRKESPILRQLEESVRFQIVGAIQNLATGEVTFVQ
jgi:carbonic anhydrase